MTPDHDLHPLPALPGTYALLIPIAAPLSLEVGRLGMVTLEPGRALYVGSAFGPGGLRARVGRHRRAEKKRRWHIDALTLAAPVAGVYATTAPERLECCWAAALAALPGTQAPMPGFGASDCGCWTHLIWLPTGGEPDPILAVLSATTTADVLLY